MACYAKKVIEIASGEVGYKEKASNTSLDSPTANAGSKNYTKYANEIDTKYPSWYNGKKNGYSWCDVFVDWCFIQAFGVANAMRLLCQPEKSLGAGCKYSKQYYQVKGQFHAKDPKIGDQIFFGTATTVEHTGLVEKVTATQVYTIEGNSENEVKRHRYALSNARILGYGRPAYDEAVNEYTIKKGDTLTAIAKKHSTTVAAITELNNLTNPNVIRVGQVLMIPEAESKWIPAVGDIVKFTSGVHYGSANGSVSSRARPGKAEILRIYQLGKSKHPYCLKAVRGDSSTVCGWVDEGSFEKL